MRVRAAVIVPLLLLLVLDGHFASVAAGASLGKSNRRHHKKSENASPFDASAMIEALQRGGSRRKAELEELANDFTNMVTGKGDDDEGKVSKGGKNAFNMNAFEENLVSYIVEERLLQLRRATKFAHKVMNTDLSLRHMKHKHDSPGHVAALQSLKQHFRKDMLSVTSRNLEETGPEDEEDSDDMVPGSEEDEAADFDPEAEKREEEIKEKGIFGIKDLKKGSAEAGELTEEEKKAKELVDERESKAEKNKGYKFLVVCLILCIAIGFIAFAFENMYQRKLVQRWKDTYGAACTPDTEFPDHPRWECPKEMTVGQFSSGGKAEYLAFLPFLSGMASGFIFGFIDNAGLFFGMSYLDPLLPHSLPTWMGGTGKNDEKVFSGMGNTFSDLIGAFLGTFAGRMLVIALDYEGGYPPIAEAFGVSFGCVVGVLIPHMIVGDEQAKADKAAREKLLHYLPETFTEGEGSKLSDVEKLFDKYDVPESDHPGQINVNLLTSNTGSAWDPYLIKADKLGSNDGMVSREEVYNVMTLEWLELVVEDSSRAKEGTFVPENEEQCYDVVYGDAGDKI